MEHNGEKWKQHLLKMDGNRIPKQAVAYNAHGEREVRRQRKRWNHK
jgi:hypothetical protein